MGIYWIIAFILYVAFSFQYICYLRGKSSYNNILGEKNNALNLDIKKAQSEVDSLKRQLEQEKMARRVDNVATKVKAQFDAILTEVTEEASIALSTMADDVKKVKQNVPVVKSPVSIDEASNHMQVKRNKIDKEFAEQLA
jgi:hypothetical protein|tara:strand:- start:27602 stop:28021 length:420 start_codon:yes stop_codon:yes gene_type:complete